MNVLPIPQFLPRFPVSYQNLLGFCFSISVLTANGVFTYSLASQYVRVAFISAFASQYVRVAFISAFYESKLCSGQVVCSAY